MSTIPELEARIDAALAKLDSAAKSPSPEELEKAEAMSAEIDKLKEKLAKEERVHQTLQEEFLDVSQDFGAMELQMMADASSASKAGDDLAELKRQRAQDVAEVDAILEKLTPLVEG